MQTVMTVEEIREFLRVEFPQINALGEAFSVEEVSDGQAVMRLRVGKMHLRPGGTVSGPAMMTLADLAAYTAILAHVGPVALAVTTNLNINFLKKPAEGDLLATCSLLKLGKRLAVVECGIRSVGEDDLCAHATATYSLPPR
ncbi:PaaI family thioesterase [Roseibium sp. CAU 1637]|uniref:PaaI family thioesterase n=2 Tax=Stappiaceae TaxID=2821832 RepID=A0A939ENM1_9HYPH|nr:PaaI family thioesterase [Roseibium limicola]MBO0344673.1 PaaI family thioesterase [Roseibium limicola]